MKVGPTAEKLIRQMRRQGVEEFTLIWSPSDKKPYCLLVDGQIDGLNESISYNGKTALQAFRKVAAEWTKMTA